MAFKKGQSGNPLGRGKGVKNKKNKEWEELSQSITEGHSEYFNNYLNELWAGSLEDKHRAAQLFLQVLKYFKPKISNVEYTMTEPNTVSTIKFVDASVERNQ